MSSASQNPEQPDTLPAHVVCPACRGSLLAWDSQSTCTQCGESFETRLGIPLLVAAGSLVTDVNAQHALYESIAHTYDDIFRPYITEHYLSRRVALVRALLLSGRILDVGCGTGVLAERLASAGFQVTGVDLSPAMLDRARARGIRETYAALSTALPFQDGSFDLAISVATLHHLETPERVAGTVAEMARVVRSGGLVVLWDHNPQNPYWPLLMRRVPQDSGHERLVPLAEVRAAVHAAGLDITQMQQTGFVPDFLPAWLMPPWQVLERLVEATPGLRRLAAHNVVVARRR